MEGGWTIEKSPTLRNSVLIRHGFVLVFELIVAFYDEMLRCGGLARSTIFDAALGWSANNRQVVDRIALFSVTSLTVGIGESKSEDVRQRLEDHRQA